MSFLTECVNEMSNCFAPAAILGAVGYLMGSVIKEIRPEAGLICGLITGLVARIFWQKGCNVSSIAIGVGMVLVLPFHACKYFKYSISYPMALVVTGTAIMITGLAHFVLHKAQSASNSGWQAKY